MKTNEFKEGVLIGQMLASTLAIVVLAVAAIDTFGLLKGIGIWAAVWLLSPRKST